MAEKKIVIWGAGRIGRGFIGDLFNAAGYQLTFIDEAQALVDGLRKERTYRVVRAAGADQIETVDITGFSIFHTSENRAIQEEINKTDLIALAVYPENFQSVAEKLQDHILTRRKNRGDEASLDILLCTNLIHAGPKFEVFLLGGLSVSDKKYFKEKVGIVETLVIRICPNPPEDVASEYPFIVWTNGYLELPVDKNGFKGTIPPVPALHIVEDMRAEEIRKIYTYNMCHAVLAYHGHMAGHTLLVECLADPLIRFEAEGALDEVSAALQKEYSFTKEEMGIWVHGVLAHTNNPTIGDTVIRSAAGPLRKLKRDDRLIGPIQLCLRNGIDPKHLIKAVGAVLHYSEEKDVASLKLSKLIKEKGVRNTVVEVCGLTQEDALLINRIEDAYKYLEEVVPWSEKAEKAYSLGFEYERNYHGCGQCAIAATTEVLGNFDDEVFNSATGLCAGVGLVTDDTCSALTGGAMAIGMVYPRHRECFDGDRDNKYLNFELVQKLRDRFIQEYGTTTCGKIHEKIYGRVYDMRLAEERQAFEEAGGHGDRGCTEVVAKAAQWTIEVLKDRLDKKER
ncbi:MAG: C-GCAxxG-C-C family protein [Anaerolineaceae bacterium]|nr:C-GCAxxG-C-C family protein [Anaerolineaceae bacterium]